MFISLFDFLKAFIALVAYFTILPLISYSLEDIDVGVHNTKCNIRQNQEHDVVFADIKRGYVPLNARLFVFDQFIQNSFYLNRSAIYNVKLFFFAYLNHIAFLYKNWCITKIVRRSSQQNINSKC